MLDNLPNWLEVIPLRVAVSSDWIDLADIFCKLFAGSAFTCAAFNSTAWLELRAAIVLGGILAKVAGGILETSLAGSVLSVVEVT